MIGVLIHNFRIGLEAIMQNKLRSVLTSLGIICGVASVIAMLAIGQGAQEEILEKMKLLGTNNIIIKPLDPDKIQDEEKEEDSGSDSESDDITKKKKKFSPGLTLKDAESIREYIPGVKFVSPEIVLETTAMRKGRKQQIKLVGIGRDYFFTNPFEISDGGEFSDISYENFKSVCIIGSSISKKLFATDNPVGRKLKCGSNWLTVAGVLKEKSLSKDNIKNLGLRDFNMDVYIPVTTMLMRYENRAMITKRDLTRWARRQADREGLNTDQLDKIVVGVDNTDNMRTIAELLGRMMFRRHNEEVDYEIIVPEVLLEQEQRTKNIFNIVLGAIASISLIVGGIGIMNIMLASVLERIREIGVRRALGARQRDILLQFMSEAVAISLTGGFIGIITGVALSLIIEQVTEIRTIVSWVSVVLSFFVSISVGIIFGIMPARRAAMQDPIESLRYE